MTQHREHCRQKRAIGWGGLGLVSAIAGLFLVNGECQAQQLLVGLNAGFRELTMTSTNRKHTLAKLRTDGIGLAPFLSLQGEPAFFGDTNWGWTVTSNVLLSTFSRQLVTSDNTTTSKDYGTDVTGLSFFIDPVIYYQFPDTGPWQWRAGGALGLGYQNHWGSFVVTDTSSEYEGQTENLRISGVGASAGLYLELSRGDHHLVLNADVITPLSEVHGDDFDYYYTETAIYLTYSYAIAHF